MISYSTESLSKLEVIEESKIYLDNSIIGEDQFNLIKEKYNHNLFIPNIFVRIGLFILTFISASAAFGMFLTFMVFSSSNSKTFGIYALIFGIITVVALEGSISIKKAYKAGIDDCLLYFAAASIITGICLIVDPSSENELLVYSIIALPFFVSAVIRYLDNSMVVGAFISLTLILFATLLKMGEIAKAISPFILMLSSGAIFFQTQKVIIKEELHFWKINLQTLQCCALIGFYLAGNYFVVRELSVELLNLNLAVNEDIPFSFLFHLTTLFIPLAYIYFAVQQKNRWFFWCGLLCLILTVLTFKYYYSIAPIGYALTFGGAIITALVWGCIKYFSPSKWNVTAEKRDELKTNDLEGLVVSYSFPIKDVPVNTGFEMGGGDFGGGGAGGTY